MRVRELAELLYAQLVRDHVVSGKLPPHSKAKLTIKPSAIGAQILRYLAVVGLGHKVTVELSVAARPAAGQATAGRAGAHIERPIRVL